MRAFLLLPVMLLSACSWVVPAPDESRARLAEESRAELAAWQFKGRVQTTDQRASLRWRQQGAEFDLLLRGPFGLGGLRIVGSPQGVTIDDGEQRIVSEDPMRDIAERTGLIVPLAFLQFWALGLPAPDAPAAVVRDDLGFIVLIEQGGWRIELADYTEDAGILWPYSLRLSRDDQLFQIEVSQWKPL